MVSLFLRRLLSLSLLLAISLLHVQQTWSQTPKKTRSAGRVAQVATIKGKALVRNGDEKKAYRALQLNEWIHRGDVINTGSEAAVKLLFTDRTVVDIGPSTLFHVDKYELKNVAHRNVSMNMQYGKVRASVNRKVKKLSLIHI